MWHEAAANATETMCRLAKVPPAIFGGRTDPRSASAPSKIATIAQSAGRARQELAVGKILK
eukprot:scaffold86352_cov29-Tisochrysis_lutea.AAC.2